MQRFVVGRERALARALSWHRRYRGSVALAVALVVVVVVVALVAVVVVADGRRELVMARQARTPWRLRLWAAKRTRYLRTAAAADDRQAWLAFDIMALAR